MKITLSPARSDAHLEASVSGEVLTLNGVDISFAGVKDGDIIAAEDTGCDWISGLVTRSDGEIELTLILPHGSNAPPETLFPQAIYAEDGPIMLPPYDAVSGQA